MVDRRFSIFAALLLVPAVLALTPVPLVPKVAAVNTLSILLIGNVAGWNSSSVSNPTITVTQGDNVSITLSSTDTMHQFALDVDKDGAKFIGSCPPGDVCSNVFSPGSGTRFSFIANFAPGTYTYFCTFHSTMVGSFVVNTSPTVGGTVFPTDKLALVDPYLALASALAVVVAAAVYLKRNRRMRKET